MEFSISDGFYLVSNMFSVYVVHRFMKIFFEEKPIRKKLEFLSYVFFFCILSMTYLLMNIPIVTLAVNIFGFFLLTFNYKAKIRNRVIAAIFIYLVLFVIESMIVLPTQYWGASIFNEGAGYSSILGMITKNMISYVIVLELKSKKNIKKGIIMPSRYQTAIFLVPAGSLFIIIMLFHADTLEMYHVLLCIAILLHFNFVVFHTYDMLIASFEEQMEKTLLKQQNAYYTAQFELMKDSDENIRSIRHDIKNYLCTIEAFIAAEKMEKASNLITQVIQNLYIKKEYAHSGNLDMDSILNYKLAEAEHKGIEISLEMKIPPKLKVVTYDMVIIFGNLLDNAIHAACKLQENMRINMQVKYNKGILLIHVDNPFNGQVYKHGNEIISSKNDKDNHGLGLKNIKDTLTKYDGTMEIQYTENKFNIDVLMYVLES